MGFIAYARRRTAEASNALLLRAVRFALSKGYTLGDYGALWLRAKELGLIGGNVSDPYSQIPTVYKAVKAIADNVPQAELIFKNYATEKEEFPEDLINLFENPNPFMSGNDFLQACVGFYALCGEVMIIKDAETIGQQTGTQLPAGLYVFHPKKFKAVKTTVKGMEVIAGWKVHGVYFPKEEVIHIKDFNTQDDARGMAPPIQDLVDVDYLAMLYNKAFFKNDATPGFMLTTEKSVTPLQVKQLQQMLQTEFAGASKAKKTLVVGEGLKPAQVGINQKDMEFTEGKRFTREELLGIWRVPKALFNITDDLNYATFKGQMRVFWIYEIAPLLVKFAAAWNRAIIRPFNPKVYCEYDYANAPAFQEDFGDKLDMATKLFSMGIPLNDIVEKLQLGFDKFPWGDTGFLPFNLTPVDMLTAPPEPATPPPADNSGDQPKGMKSALPVKDKEKHARIWKGFLNRHYVLERKFMRSISNFFFAQRSRVLEQVYSKQKDAMFHVVIDWAKEDEELLKKAMPFLFTGINEGVDFGAKLVGQKPEDVAALKLRVKSYLAVRLTKMKAINNTVRRQVTGAVQNALESQSTTTEELAQNIRNIYNMATARSRTIARTEMTGAINGGSDLYYQEVGVEKKQWVTAGDENVRPWHAEIEGEIRRVDERFSNGLDYPGGDGPPEEVINCRCTFVPVVEE